MGSTDGVKCGVSDSTRFSPSQVVEDRFIGVADYKEFLHNPHDVCLHASGSMAGARYRKTLELRMGLGVSGLMLFHSSDHTFGSSHRDAADGDDHCSASPCWTNRGDDMGETYGQSEIINTDDATEMGQDITRGVFCTPPCTPTANCSRTFFPLHQRTTSTFSSTQHTSVAHVEMNDNYHTPVTVSKTWGDGYHQENRPFGGIGLNSNSGSPFSCSQRGDGLWGRPLPNINGNASPIHGPRLSDLGAGTFSAGSQPGLPTTTTTSPSTTVIPSTTTAAATTIFNAASTPQLRTPVRHENDLLTTPIRGGYAGSTGFPQSASPVLRRNVLYSQHTTPRRQGETCSRVLNAEGLSLCDDQGRPNFNPLCWGHMGAIVALQRSVYLWQAPGRTYSLFESPNPTSLVTAVSSSRRVTEMGDIFLAIGMNDGVIVVLKYHVGYYGDSMEDKRIPVTSSDILSEETTARALFNVHTSHISTLHVVDYFLYSGCMHGILAVRNLRDGSVIWRTAASHPQLDFFSCASSLQSDYRVDVGAPIYKLEVTPDGDHIAVGTKDSLFVYQTKSIGPENRTRRRVVFSGSSRPVRAFCWWRLPFSSSNGYATDARHSPVTSNRFDLRTILLYGGGSDGSVLSVYSVGSRCDKVTCLLSAPILAIVSSETCDEILVSVDTTDGENIVAGRRLSHADEWGTGPATDSGMRADADDSNDGRFRDPNGDWASYDISSDEEELPQVSYVNQFFPTTTAATTGATATAPTTTTWRRNNRNNILAGGFPMRFPRVTLPHLAHHIETMRMRPLLSSFHDAAHAGELLQLFRLKDGGTTLERLSGFASPRNASMYIALSPDNSLLSTAGSELKMRIWGAFKPKKSDHAIQCDFR